MKTNKLGLVFFGVSLLILIGIGGPFADSQLTHAQTIHCVGEDVPENCVVKMAWLPNGEMLAVAKQREILLFSSSDDFPHKHILLENVELITDFEISTSGRFLAVSYANLEAVGYTIAVFDEALEQVALRSDLIPIGDIEFDEEEQTLVFVSLGGTVFFWDFNQDILSEPIELGGTSKSIFLMPGESTVIIVGYDGTALVRIRLWDIENIEQMRLRDTFIGGESLTYASAYDSRTNSVSLFVDTVFGRFIYLWNLDSGVLVLKTPRLDSVIQAISFHPTEDKFATCSETGEITFWGFDGLIHTIIESGHEGMITGLAWIPDGDVLVSSGDDGRVLFWETETGQLIRSIELE